MHQCLLGNITENEPWEVTTASVGQELYPMESQTSSLAWEKYVEPFQLLGAVSDQRLLLGMYEFPSAVGSKCSLERPLHKGRALCAKYFVF